MNWNGPGPMGAWPVGHRNTTLSADGRLNWARWRTLNKHLSMGGLSRDEAISLFCEVYGIRRQHIEAELAAYRLNAPEMMQ